MIIEYLLSKVIDSSLATSPCRRGTDASIYMYQDPSWADDGPVLLDGVDPCKLKEHAFEFEFIGVLCHMQRYFSHICDGTDVQAD